MSNVLFFPVWTVSPHFETDLELMQNAIDNDDIVYFVYCNKNFKICDNNTNYDPEKCKSCMTKRKKAVRLLNSRNVKVINLNRYRRQKKIQTISCPEISQTQELLQLYYHNFDVGYAIGSTLSNELCESGVVENYKKISDLYKSAISFYELINDLIDEYQINKGYIFNGRFSFAKAFFRACEKNLVDVYTHERGSSFTKYCTIRNNLPHQIDAYTKRVQDFWNDNTDFETKKKIASDYFSNKRFGNSTDYISFTNKQKIGVLPAFFENYQKKIVIFNSSVFEYDFVSSEYDYKYYKSQNDGIKKIVEALSNYPDVGVFLREHPNLKGHDNIQRRELREIASSNFTLIPAESDISSYDLLLNSDCVITFNSTMGIEATYWRKPSVLCSNAIYQNLNIAYMPDSHDELINLLLSSLQPIDQIDTLKYGYYHGSFGTEFKYYQPTDFFSGRFKGIDLMKQRNKAYQVLRKIKKMILLR